MTDNFQDAVGKKIVEALKSKDDNAQASINPTESPITSQPPFGLDIAVDNNEFASDMQNQLLCLQKKEANIFGI